MNSNPIHSAPVAKSYLPFIICCVIGSEEDEKEIEELFQIKKFCEDNNVKFTSREFDAEKFEEDCLYIKTLPSFHIYDKKRTTQGIFTLADEPLEKIKAQITKYKLIEEEEKRKQEVWNQRFESVKGLFSVFTKQSILRK